VGALNAQSRLSAGACTATWALTGSYTGPDTLSADFTATFTGSCGDCTNQSFPVLSQNSIVVSVHHSAKSGELSADG